MTPERRSLVLQKAALLYERLASGEYKLYDQNKYRFFDPDKAVTGEIADDLYAIRRESMVSSAEQDGDESARSK